MQKGSIQQLKPGMALNRVFRSTVQACGDEVRKARVETCKGCQIDSG